MKSEIEQLKQRIAAYKDLDDNIGLDMLQKQLIERQGQYITQLEEMLLQCQMPIRKTA